MDSPKLQAHGTNIQVREAFCYTSLSKKNDGTAGND